MRENEREGGRERKREDEGRERGKKGGREEGRERRQFLLVKNISSQVSNLISFPHISQADL